MSSDLKTVLKLANDEIGYRETGTNNTKYNHELGSISGYPHAGYGYPWCQSFQSWLQKHAGGTANVDYPRTAGCASAVSWFKGKKRFSSKPQVGDMVFYGPGGSTHVELVVAVSDAYITTVGGNTSGSLGGNYFNGDGVYRKTVSRSSDRIYGYGHPVYGVPVSPTKPAPKPIVQAPKPLPKPKPKPVAVPRTWNNLRTLKRGSSGSRVKQLQHALNVAYRALPQLTEDGEFGPATEATLKRFQKYAGLTQDGVYGKLSEGKLRALAKVRG